MLTTIINACKTVINRIKDKIKQLTKPTTPAKSRKPRIPQEAVELIRQMAIENPSWGAKKIQGELLKLDIYIHKRTIKRYMRQVRKRNSGQNWATFLKNHAADIWACDFTVVHNVWCKPLYVFVLIHHQTRRIVHAAVTTAPTDEWTAQQLREATAWGEKPKYLIRDNDGKYGQRFAAAAAGIEVLKTPFGAPRANAICERFMGSLKRECLDHVLILSERQLRRIVAEFVDYYNGQRPHQRIGQRMPARFGDRPVARPRARPQKVKGRVRAKPILNGLHHSYAYVGVGR